jgi:predicted XRE-type DNA-binding protein
MSQTISSKNTLPSSRPAHSWPAPIPKPEPLTPTQESALAAKDQALALRSIKQGLADGSLTQAEASKLLAQQARISALMSSTFEDGEVTEAERRALYPMQMEASSDILDLMTNHDRSKPVLDPLTLEKQSAQLEQLSQGILSGQLSGNEAATLLEYQGGLAQAASEIEADGQVDWLERLEVDMKQEGADWNITSATQNEEWALHGNAEPPTQPEPQPEPQPQR